MPSLQWLLSALRTKIQNPCCVGSKVRPDSLPPSPRPHFILPHASCSPFPTSIRSSAHGKYWPPSLLPLKQQAPPHPWGLGFNTTSSEKTFWTSLSTGIPTSHHYSYYHVYFLQIPVSQFAIILFVYFCFVCLPTGVNIPIMASFKQTWHHCTWSWEEMGSSHY